MHKILIARGITQHLRRNRNLYVFSVLALMCGFEATITLGFIDYRFATIGSACLWVLLCLFCIYLFLPRTHVKSLSDIDMTSLLERNIVPLETEKAHIILKGRVVLVTGAAGSIGSELCRQLLDYEPARLIALDNNETGLFDLAESLQSHPHAACFYPCIDDIRDTLGMQRLFVDERPQVVFHAAAYKHVPLLENHPEQAIRSNTIATFQLCRLAETYGVDRFVFISTDKAANPTSILGATKRLGEIIVQSLAQATDGRTCFCAIRFGNVIGSRGSVVPVFTRQIIQGGPLTVTDPAATRYFMTIPEACDLVIHSAALADQGALYLLDMGEPVRILALAIKMIHLFGLREGIDIPIVYTGLRRGEHLHETLMAKGEELIPTANKKIFKVYHASKMPIFSTVTRWIHDLNEDLQNGHNEQLRERLFEFVKLSDPIITSGDFMITSHKKKRNVGQGILTSRTGEREIDD